MHAGCVSSYRSRSVFGLVCSRRGGGGSFRDVFGGVNKLLWKRASIVVLLIMFFDGMVSGYGHALMPVAAVNVFGYTTEQWSGLVGPQKR